MKKQVSKNLFSNYASRGLGLVLSLLLVPFLIHKLGKEAFGVIVMAESLILFADVANVSIRTSLARHATYSLFQGRLRDYAEYLSTGRCLFFIVSAVVLLAGFSLSLFLTHVLRIPDALLAATQALFLLMVLTLVVSIPNSVFWAALYSHQRLDLINFCVSFGVIWRGVATFTAFWFLPARYVSLTTYGLIYLTEALAENWIIYFWCKRVIPDLEIRVGNFKEEKVREVLSFSVYTSMGNLSTVVFENATNILINLFWGPFANAVYGVSMKFAVMLRRLFLESTWALTPTFTRLAAVNDRETTRKLFFAYSKVVAIVSLPVSLLLILASGPIVHAWVGPEFSMAAVLMPIQVLPLLLVIPGSASASLIAAHGKVRVPSVMSVCSTLLKIGLGVLLAKGFSMGLVGMAAASTTITILYVILFSHNYACRAAGISITEFWKQTYLRPLAWALVTVFAAAWVFQGLRLDWGRSYSAVIGITAALAAVYGFGAYKMVMSPGDKKEIWQFVSSLKTGIP